MRISSVAVVPFLALVIVGAGCVKAPAPSTDTTPQNNQPTNDSSEVIDYDSLLLALPVDSATGEAIICLPNNEPRTLRVPAGYEDVWVTYQGSTFGIAYPDEFESNISLGADYASFVSPDGDVTFSVYAPLWNGTPEQLVAQNDESVVAQSKILQSPVSCVTQLGVSSRVNYTATVIRESDGSTLRSVADIELVPDDGSSGVRMTFAFEFANAELFTKYQKLFELFMSTLVQYADA